MQGRPTGAIIRNFILNNFLKHKIVLEHCCPQIYDGSRSMASKCRGASAVTKRKQPQVEFIHSTSQLHNLAVLFARRKKFIRGFMTDLT